MSYINEEVNRTVSSPSVSIPWLILPVISVSVTFVVARNDVKDDG